MHFLCPVIQLESALAAATHRVLELYGLRPYRVATQGAAASALRQWRFDAALLDTEGFGDDAGDCVGEMLMMLRETQVPIVVRSGRFDEATQFRRLEQGATAMVPSREPMRLTALRLRKLAELRRHEAGEVPAEVRLGPLLIDTRRARASVRCRPLGLTSRQFEILLLLATRPGEFVHRREFAGSSRQPSEEGSRSVDMQVSRIRTKLRDIGPSGLFICAVSGLGYCLSFKQDPAALERVSEMRIRHAPPADPWRSAAGAA